LRKKGKKGIESKEAKMNEEWRASGGWKWKCAFLIGERGRILPEGN